MHIQFEQCVRVKVHYPLIPPITSHRLPSSRLPNCTPALEMRRDFVRGPLELDMHDTKENRQWILRYAEKVLLKRFNQEAIYVRFVSGTESYLIRRVAST